MTADFPFARSLIVVRSEQTVKKTGRTTTEARYYLSSVPAQDPTPERWLAWIRGHWGGVEIRNHWRRDAVLGEDGSRSRNVTLQSPQFNAAAVLESPHHQRFTPFYPAISLALAMARVGRERMLWTRCWNRPGNVRSGCGVPQA